MWEALVNQTTRWWRKDFYTSEKTRGFHIEARPGGRMYEDWGDDNGLLWATVLSVDAPRTILLFVALTPEYGGPAQTMFRFTVEPEVNTCVVRVSDTIFGNISEQMSAQMQEGWKLLFEKGLKPFVEGN